MKSLTLATAVLVVLFFIVSAEAINGAGQAAYPSHPELSVTPGAVCENPTEYRYPEHIKYCARNVSVELKDQVIRDYDQKFGYRVESMSRADFKIDHFIPLCMGGANTVENLWPQHKSVYVITDSFEADLCGQLAAARITQAQAIEKIKQIKMTVSVGQ